MTTYRLITPVSEGEIRKLKVSDVLFISGTVVTARDQAHKRALEWAKEGKALPLNLEGLALFHCGPVTRKKGEKWLAIAAGPTTSTRMEAYEGQFIEKFKPNVIIGKGGMGKRTAAALEKFGGVYCVFTGGAAVLAAKFIRQVKGVEWLDLGMPEAMWVFEVKSFGPLVVAIDSHGNNFFSKAADNVEARRMLIYRKFGLNSS